MHGRFTAVDPLLASGKSANPQTFNRYVYCLNNPLILTDPSGLQVASWKGKVFYNAKTDEFSNQGGNGFERYKGPTITESRGGWTYTISSGGWINLGKTSVINERAEKFAQTQLQGIPFGNPKRNDDESGGGMFENFTTRSREFATNVLLSGSKLAWNFASSIAPDYGKISGQFVVVSYEFSMDRYFRPYVGFSTPFGDYTNRSGLNLLDDSRPRSFGIKPPNVALGWFVNIGNGRKEIGDAMGGGNLGLSSFGVGMSKSLPNPPITSFNDVAATPTALEFGAITPGAGLSYSGEIPCQFCADVRQGITNSRINPYNFRRP